MERINVMDQSRESSGSGKKKKVSPFNPVRQEINKPANEVFKKIRQELKESSDREYQESESRIYSMRSSNGNFDDKTLQKCRILRIYNEALILRKTDFLSASEAHSEAIKLAYEKNITVEKLKEKQKNLRKEIEDELNNLQGRGGYSN